ncbi:TIL domain-containing protein [Trichonephila inaurata madagascariensis]|uniref:TIL domain-containing protein n=1 Tax=Trichonephila inaurata madagascariensis TaxID=2747483 RepID=A0A8X6X320_9ARAC|nr:TIL domain-containing protein [Trichonephila inaurata madagascariensis]GFY70235.1 TIL domain-containing protein [Trichonephila inaurata madagascariensis]
MKSLYKSDAFQLIISTATSVMKTIFFLCCVAVFAVIASSDDSEEIDADYFDKIGLSKKCHGNQTFSSYSMCDKRCDQMKPPTHCSEEIYVGCGCKQHYIAVDSSFSKCVRPKDCP